MCKGTNFQFKEVLYKTKKIQKTKLEEYLFYIKCVYITEFLVYEKFMSDFLFILKIKWFIIKNKIVYEKFMGHFSFIYNKINKINLIQSKKNTIEFLLLYIYDQVFFNYLLYSFSYYNLDIPMGSHIIFQSALLFFLLYNLITKYISNNNNKKEA